MTEIRKFVLPKHTDFKFTDEIRDDNEITITSIQTPAMPDVMRITLISMIAYSMDGSTYIAHVSGKGKCTVRFIKDENTFMKENQIFRKLEPCAEGCICKFIDSGLVTYGKKQQSVGVIVTEFTDGSMWSLFDTWNESPIDKISLICNIFGQVCRIAKQLLDLGICHGFIEPGAFAFRYTDDRISAVIRLNDLGACSVWGDKWNMPGYYDDEEEFLEDFKKVTSPRILHMFYLQLSDEKFKCAVRSAGGDMFKKYMHLLDMTTKYSREWTLAEMAKAAGDVKVAALKLRKDPNLKLAPSTSKITDY